MIKIFPTIQIKELDAYTIENEPVASIDLMERASQALAKTISERWNTETPFTVFAGPGNNGGDALAVSRLLAQQGYRVEVYLFNTKGSLSPDCETNKKRLTELSGIDFHEITTQFVPPELTARHVVLDGLFGSGLNKPLSGGFAAVVAESRPAMAWKIGIDGLWNVLEVAREYGCAVFTPSSIGSFGENTPHVKTPQDTIQRPRTMYGVTKVTTELLSDYYYTKYGVDTRAVRFPGIISNVTPPGGGTTDYAVDIFYSAVKGEKFVCPVKAGTFMDMMYMPDAINAAISLMEAAPARLKHRNAFNIASMSFDPEMIYAAIKKHVPDFEMTYQIDPLKQAIADSWPDSLDDSCAREEWDWMPQFDLDSMTVDMLEKLRAKLNK